MLKNVLNTPAYCKSDHIHAEFEKIWNMVPVFLLLTLSKSLTISETLPLKWLFKTIVHLKNLIPLY